MKIIPLSVKSRASCCLTLLIHKMVELMNTNWLDFLHLACLVWAEMRVNNVYKDQSWTTEVGRQKIPLPDNMIMLVRLVRRAFIMDSLYSIESRLPVSPTVSNHRGDHSSGYKTANSFPASELDLVWKIYLLSQKVNGWIFLMANVESDSQRM